MLIPPWPGTPLRGIRQLHPDSVGASVSRWGAATRLLMRATTPGEVRHSGGVGDYVISLNRDGLSKNWPIPDSVPRPITGRVWAQEGAKILEQGEIVSGHLTSAHVIAPRYRPGSQAPCGGDSRFGCPDVARRATAH